MATLNTPEGAPIRALNTSDLIVSAVGAANAAVTATLPAAGVGLYHYITAIEIMRAGAAALAGTAALTITTTNLPGNLAWSKGNAMAAGGTSNDVNLNFGPPVRSSLPNTATTIVCPAPGAGVLWRCNVYYFVAS